jgi:hypothetical protein
MGLVVGFQQGPLELSYLAILKAEEMPSPAGGHQKNSDCDPEKSGHERVFLCGSGQCLRGRIGEVHWGNADSNPLAIRNGQSTAAEQVLNWNELQIGNSTRKSGLSI